MNTQASRNCLPNLIYPRWSETLHDHSHVLIRPIHPQDSAAERAFIESLSLEARRYRFLGSMGRPSDRLIEQLTDIDYRHEMAFVAVVQEDAHEKIVGVSRYSTDQEGHNCECAVTVADAWQNKGLGTLLMKHLIEVARGNGIQRMYSIDSVENVEMTDLAKHLGFHTRRDPEDVRQVLHELDLQAFHTTEMRGVSTGGK